MAEKKEEKPESQKHEKKKIIMKGVGINFLAYIVIALILSVLGVPPLVVSMIVLVLIWGLFVMAYAYYYHK